MSGVRQFRWRDYDQVVDVWRASGADALSRAELEAKLVRDPELFLVAEVGEVVAETGAAVGENPEELGEGSASAGEDGADLAATGVGIAGVVLGTYDGRRGWIFRLGVHPEHRRRGVATRLVAELERRFQALGCPRINLLVLPENEAGLRFWQSLGYLPYPDVLCSKPVPTIR